MGDTKKYTLTVDAAQLRVVMNALDLYNRLGLGQFKEIVNNLNELFVHLPQDEFYARRDDVERHLETAKGVLLGLGPHSYNGIFSPLVGKPSKMAWELIQVFRRHLAYEREPKGGWSVDFDPFMPCSDHPNRAEIATVTPTKPLEPEPSVSPTLRQMLRAARGCSYHQGFRGEEGTAIKHAAYCDSCADVTLRQMP